MVPFTHTREDGAVVSLSGPRWRLEILRDGKHDEVPQEWLSEHASGARHVTLRKIAEPMAWPDSLTNDVRRTLDEMSKLKSGEREAFDFALLIGRPVTLKNLLRGLDGRKAKGVADKVSTAALVRRVTAVEGKCIEAIDAATVARLDAWFASFQAEAKGGAQ
jgi:hypothetical protein